MTILVEEPAKDVFEITGLIDGREIVCIDYSDGAWVVSMSKNLPLQLSAAREHVAVLNAALAEVDRIEVRKTAAPAEMASSS
jgi:hypothetical protein